MDYLNDAVKVSVHVVVGETKDRVPLLTQSFGATFIALDVFLCRMRGAANFDDEPCFVTAEVDDIIAKNNLSAKFESANLLAPQPGPQSTFGGSRFLSESARDGR
jgi:hypothetical protein